MEKVREKIPVHNFLFPCLKLLKIVHESLMSSPQPFANVKNTFGLLDVETFARIVTRK
jgi:hypothetical protein